MPHALPTGRFGKREIRIQLSWPGGSLERPFAKAPATSVAAGAARIVTLPLPPGLAPGEVSAALLRFDHLSQDWVAFVSSSPP